MKNVKIVAKLELQMEGEVVGYEYHAIDPDIGHIGIYHQDLEDYKANTKHSKLPVTMGDLNYLFHDQKILIEFDKDYFGVERFSAV